MNSVPAMSDRHKQLAAAMASADASLAAIALWRSTLKRKTLRVLKDEVAAATLLVLEERLQGVRDAIEIRVFNANLQKAEPLGDDLLRQLSEQEAEVAAFKLSYPDLVVLEKRRWWQFGK